MAKAPQSGHPEAGGIYHVIVCLSLEPDRHFLGHVNRNSLSLNVAVLLIKADAKCRAQYAQFIDSKTIDAREIHFADFVSMPQSDSTPVGHR